MAKEERALWRKWGWRRLMAGVIVLAISSTTAGKNIVPNEVRTHDMIRYQGYLQLNPRTWTPVVIRLMNDPFLLRPPE